MIELAANLGADIRWYVNDTPVSPQPDGRFFWQLAPGKWRLQAASSAGVSEETITVE